MCWPAINLNSLVFKKIAKRLTSFVKPACLSVHMKQLASHWMDFLSLQWGNLLKSVDKTQFWLTLDNNGHFT
jgi:hypothetical protein